MSLTKLGMPIDTILHGNIYIFNENFIKKKIILERNYSKFKMITKLIIQNKSFLKKINGINKKLILSNDKNEMYLAKYNIIFNNQDNIYDINTHEYLKCSLITINKLNCSIYANLSAEINLNHDYESNYDLLHNIHFKCNYNKKNNKLCEFQSFNGFHQCKRHLKIKYIREQRICDSISSLFNNITYIILLYDNNISY